MINILIYAIIALALFVIFYREKNDTEIMDFVHSNYAEYRMELLRGDDNE